MNELLINKVKKMKRLIKNILLILLFFTVVISQNTSVANAESVLNYNASEALAYAAEHWDDKTEANGGKLDCIAFARSCAEAGGVPRDISRGETGYSVQQYVDYMVYNGYAELNKLQLSKYRTTPYYYINENKNAGKVDAGDILIYKCTEESCPKPYFHATLCAPADTDGKYEGYYRYYAHRTAVNNKLACAIKCSKCGCPSSQIEIYALHITSAANGYTGYKDKVQIKVSRAAYNQLKISWKAVPGANEYKVLYKKSKNGFFTPLMTVSGTSAIHTISSDQYAGSIYYAVLPCKVINGKQHTGAISSTVSNYTVADKPANITPKLYGYRQIKVTWDKAEGATGYKVEYKKSGSSKWSFLEFSADTSAKISKATSGKKYYFKITPYTTSKLYKSKRLSPNYATASVYTLKKLSAPKVSKASSKSVYVKWTNISGESGYQIACSTNKSKGFKIIKTVNKSYSKCKVSAPKNKTYYYKVRAYKVVDGKKIYAPWSSVKAYKLK